MTGGRATSPARHWQEETETASEVEDIELNAMTFAWFRRSIPQEITHTIIYYHGGCFVGGGLPLTITS